MKTLNKVLMWIAGLDALVLVILSVVKITVFAVVRWLDITIPALVLGFFALVAATIATTLLEHRQRNKYEKKDKGKDKGNSPPYYPYKTA